jgi:N-dimethylarginine dimethylaminohydrolase
MSNAVILMCPPKHFAVSYAINPWMDPVTWASQHAVLGEASRTEWDRLRQALRDLGAAIETMAPRPGVPDLVFTANAAIVLDGTALLARFRHAERGFEEPHVARAFKALRARGLIERVRTLPPGVVLEGAGDCVWDQARNLFWLGYGPRSDEAARHAVTRTFGVDVAALELADPRFYHMDTALRPLPGGEVLYFPGAFTAAGLAVIGARVLPAQRVEIGEEDACLLAANAVCIGDALVLSDCSDRLRAELAERGYRVIATPLSSFLRSGGSAFCLTLRLDQRSTAASAQRQARALAG